MRDLTHMIDTLRRPRILVRAAKFGIDDFKRSRDLRHVLETGDLPRPGEALAELLDRENDMNTWRLKKTSAYSAAHHVQLLTALMCEARFYKATLALPEREASTDAPYQRAS